MNKIVRNLTIFVGFSCLGISAVFADSNALYTNLGDGPSFVFPVTRIATMPSLYGDTIDTIVNSFGDGTTPNSIIFGGTSGPYNTLCTYDVNGNNLVSVSVTGYQYFIFQTSGNALRAAPSFESIFQTNFSSIGSPGSISNLSVTQAYFTNSSCVSSLVSVPASTPGATFTGSLQNVLDSTGATAADNLNNSAFGGMTNVVYSVIHYCVTFIFQPVVITVLVALLVIGMIANFAWTYMLDKMIRGKKRNS